MLSITALMAFRWYSHERMLSRATRIASTTCSTVFIGSGTKGSGLDTSPSKGSIRPWSLATSRLSRSVSCNSLGIKAVIRPSSIDFDMDRPSPPASSDLTGTRTCRGCCLHTLADQRECRVNCLSCLLKSNHRGLGVPAREIRSAGREPVGWRGVDARKVRLVAPQSASQRSGRLLL